MVYMLFWGVAWFKERLGIDGNKIWWAAGVVGWFFGGLFCFVAFLF